MPSCVSAAPVGETNNDGIAVLTTGVSPPVAVVLGCRQLRL